MVVKDRKLPHNEKQRLVEYGKYYLKIRKHALQ